jgi:hypothetical protein
MSFQHEYAPRLRGPLPAFVQKVANVCGSNGCVRVQTQRVVKHQKAGNVVPSRN